MAQSRLSEEELVAREILRQLPDRAKAEAALRGPAPGARPVVGREELEKWNERAADPILLYSQYVAQGLDDDTAQTKATLEAYPNRSEMMLSAGGQDPRKQAAYAARMTRLSMQSREEGATDSDVSGSDE